METQATYGIGGHGLLLTMSPTCRVMVDVVGDLVVLHDDREVARVRPSGVPATGELTWIDDDVAQLGATGPTIELASGVELEALFEGIETGFPDGQWHARAADVMVALPVGVVLVPARPDDDDPYFELHAPGGSNEFISFMPRAVPARELVVTPADYQTLVGRGTTRHDGRDIPFTECAYEHDGKHWRQLFYAVPVDADETVVIRAQASEPTIELLFQAAQAAAATLIPLR